MFGVIWASIHKDNSNRLKYTGSLLTPGSVNLKFLLNQTDDDGPHCIICTE